MITAAEVQETLRDLITQYGPPNDTNTRMYSAVLKSALVNDPREAGLIDISLDKQIPGRLFAQKNNPQIIDQLVQELISSHRIDSHAAEWIVKTWAKSMGMNVQAKKQVFPQNISSPSNNSICTTIPISNSGYSHEKNHSSNIPISPLPKKSPPPPNIQSFPSPPKSEKILCPQCGAFMSNGINDRCPMCGYGTSIQNNSPSSKMDKVPCPNCGAFISENNGGTCPMCGFEIKKPGLLDKILKPFKKIRN